MVKGTSAAEMKMSVGRRFSVATTTTPPIEADQLSAPSEVSLDAPAPGVRTPLRVPYYLDPSNSAQPAPLLAGAGSVGAGAVPWPGPWPGLLLPAPACRARCQR